MSEVTGHFKKYMDKNYFGSWDIEGNEMVVVIDHAEVNEVKNERGTEKKLTVHLQGGYKPLILNNTNGSAIEQALGSANVTDWKGKSIILFSEHGKFFGKECDAVRVKNYAPKVEFYCQECGQQITPHGKYSPQRIAEMSKGKYGKELCWDCASKLKEASENDFNAE